jgi:putative peptide zinc metalloprotease protein
MDPMLSTPPKLRSDLVISEQRTTEGRAFVVKDPATGRFFRFREAEHFIARRLDGATPFEGIRQQVEEAFGVPVALEALVQFTHHLRRLGLLEAADGGVGPLPHQRQRVQGNLLYLRLKAFDPDRFLAWLVNKVRFCFTRHFLALSGFLILVACGITLTNWEEIGRDLSRLYRVQALLLAWLTILLVTTAHELAHGLTCKRFGGEVHELGVMLLYFQPAFYCNVSDAWLFPEKAKRLWVTFAGAYFELFLWAVATLTWRVTDPASTVNYAALVVMATSAVKSFFNLNPLIKLDGYYLLSDYLEVPNLRQRAFGYSGARIKKLFGSAVAATQEVPPRERRIYLVYGLLAGAYSSFLLGVVTWNLGGFLVGRYQGLGFLLTAAFLAAVFRNPLNRMLPKWPALSRPRQGRFPAMWRLAKRLAGLAAVLSVLFLGRMELKVSGEFTVLPIRNADIRAEVDGIVEEVNVDEGDLISEGDLIARLSDRDYRAELRKMAAEIAEKQARLRMLQAGPRREEIALARKEVETAQTRHEQAWNRYTEARRMHAERLAKAMTVIEKAEERLKYALGYLSLYQPLFAEKIVSGKQLREAEEQVAVRAKELAEAQGEWKVMVVADLAELRQAVALAERQQKEAKGKLDILLAGSRREEIEATEAEIARSEAQHRYLEEQLQRVRVVSPLSGVITTPKLKERIGQHVKKGDLIAQVHALKTVRAEIALPEKEIADVQVGQAVALKARAYPETSFLGTVTAIAPAAVAQEQVWAGKVVRVSTEIDNAYFLLKPEMTGNAKIFCGKRPAFDLLTRRVARYFKVEFWSWW